MRRYSKDIVAKATYNQSFITNSSLGSRICSPQTCVLFRISVNETSIEFFYEDFCHTAISFVNDLIIRYLIIVVDVMRMVVNRKLMVKSTNYRKNIWFFN